MYYTCVFNLTKNSADKEVINGEGGRGAEEMYELQAKKMLLSI